MRWPWARLLSLLLVCAATLPAHAETKHTVASGQTLGKIARRYHVSIAELCEANRIQRRTRIRPGQVLTIPDKNSARKTQRNEDSPERSAEKSEPENDENDERDEPRSKALGGGMRQLSLPSGEAAYYFEPTGPGRHTLKPVIVYLHGRGGHPDRDCRRWAPIARRLGWLICPSGPVAHGDGRAWNNNWLFAHRSTMNAVQALRAKYGRRVQLYGNTLIGFSEGAFAAMNVGVREPRVFNRWLILAASGTYWGGPGLEALQTARERVRRVYLITGRKDGVVEGTHQVEEWLKRAGVTTRVTIPKDMGHEVLLETKPALYRGALKWLDQGEKRAARPSDQVASR